MTSAAIKDIILDWKRVTNFPFLEKISLKFKDKLIEKRYQLVLAASDNLVLKQFLLIKFFFYIVILSIELLVFRKFYLSVLIGIIPSFIFLILYIFYKGQLNILIYKNYTILYILKYQPLYQKNRIQKYEFKQENASLLIIDKSNKELFKDIVLTCMSSLIGVTFFFLTNMYKEENENSENYNGSKYMFSKDEFIQKIQISFVLGVLLSFQAASFIYLIQMWYFRITSIGILWISISVSLQAETITRVIYIILLSICMIIWFFYQDFKLKKLQFYFIYNLQKEQEGWQKLINQNLPCPVLVVKKDEEKMGEIQVVFFNQNTKKEFKRVANMDINWIVNNIYVNTHHVIDNQSDSGSQSKFHQHGTIKELYPQQQLFEHFHENEVKSEPQTIQQLDNSLTQSIGFYKFHNKQSQKHIPRRQSQYANTIQNANNHSPLLESQKQSINPDFITFQKFEIASSNQQKESELISLQKQNQKQNLQSQQKMKTGQIISNQETNSKQIKFLNMKNHLTSIIECNKLSVKQKTDQNGNNKPKKYVPLKELIIKKIENYRSAKSQQSLNNLKNQNTNFLRLEKEEHYSKCILNITLEVQKGKQYMSDKIQNGTTQDQNVENNQNHKLKSKHSRFNAPEKKCYTEEEDEEDQEYNDQHQSVKGINQNNNSLFLNSSIRKEQQSGSIEYYEMRLVECIWENELSILILMTNISDKIKTNFYREINHYKDDLINTVTHDLKTPLNGIISILESAISLTSFSEMQKCVQIARKNGVLLTAIINDIQDFQNMKKGEFKLNPQKFNLNELMIEIRELIEYQAKSKGIEFKTSLNVENVFIYNDFNRIKQIVLNLIGNALKFTFEGYVSFEITQVNNFYLRFSIADTGIGISSKLQEKIFQPYGTYQQKKNYQHGCGIGLAICQKLVQNVGNGSIELISKEGQGSTFNFLIHRYLEDEQNVLNLSKYQLQESIQSPIKTKGHGEQFYKQHQLEILKKKEIMQNYSNSKSYQHIPSGTLSIELIDDNAQIKKLNNHRGSIYSNQKIDSDKIIRDQQGNIHCHDSYFKQKSDQKNKSPKQKNILNRSHSTLLSQFSESLMVNATPMTNDYNLTKNMHQNLAKIQQSQLDIKHENSSQQLIQKQMFDEIDFDSALADNITINNKGDIQNNSKDKIQTPLQNKFKFIKTIGSSDPSYTNASRSNQSTSAFPQTLQNFNSNAKLIKDENLPEQQNGVLHQNYSLTKIKESSENFIAQGTFKKETSKQTTFNTQGSNNVSIYATQNTNIHPNTPSVNAQNIQNQQRKKGKKVTQSVLIQNNTLGKLVFSKYKKILIVDDTGFNILALKLLLKQQISQQTEVFEAFNGRQALEIVKEKYKSQQYVTLVLMDVNMPIMDGIEATRIIKNLVKEGKMNPLKIVMITAFGSLKDRQNAKLAGADAYMEKPVTVNALIAAIEQAESGEN